MGLNFLKKNDADHEKKFGASQFEYKKTTFRALKRAIKVDLLLIFVVIIPIALQKLIEGFIFQIGLPLLTLLMRHKLCLSLCTFFFI
jgi:ABC-type transport system involved in cytochrome bd biosynthesis fused ATPase/permease subunit